MQHSTSKGDHKYAGRRDRQQARRSVRAALAGHATALLRAGTHPEVVNERPGAPRGESLWTSTRTLPANAGRRSAADRCAATAGVRGPGERAK